MTLLRQTLAMEFSKLNPQSLERLTDTLVDQHGATEAEVESCVRVTMALVNSTGDSVDPVAVLRFIRDRRKPAR